MKDFLLIRIPHIVVSDEPIPQVIERLEEILLEAGAEEMGFKGFLLGSPAGKPETVTFEVRDIPLVVLIDIFATMILADLMVKDGYIVFVKRGLWVAPSVPVLIQYSENILTGLGLPSEPSPEELRDCLQRLGIDLERGFQVRSSSQTGALVMMHHREAELVKSILELIQRGVKVVPAEVID